jgi:hypothetical protein
MQLSGLSRAVSVLIAGLLCLVGIELLAEVLVSGFARPAILATLVLVVAGLGVLVAIGTRWGRDRSTPYW